MAKELKNQTPPSSIDAPGSLVPIMQAFHAGSGKVTRELIASAAKAIYGAKSDYAMDRKITKSELDGVIALMKGIDPKDTLETLIAAQIIATHMLGMRKLSEDLADDQRLGLNLLRFSNEAMMNLQRKRGGGGQNITVNYVNSGPGNALMQTQIVEKEA